MLNEISVCVMLDRLPVWLAAVGRYLKGIELPEDEDQSYRLILEIPDDKWIEAKNKVMAA